MPVAGVMSQSVGFSPHIRPRPRYPPLGTILWNFNQIFLFQTAVIGALLVHLLSPFYQYTRRAFSQDANYADDDLYFAVVASMCWFTAL
jgi:hypothetical protein